MPITFEHIEKWVTDPFIIGTITVVGVLVTLIMPLIGRMGKRRTNKQLRTYSIGDTNVINNYYPSTSTPIPVQAEPVLPPKSQLPRINNLAALPETRAKLFGRETELAKIDQAWTDPNTRIMVLEAFGGMGKTALMQTWVEAFVNRTAAESVYQWSFYSQGSAEDKQATAEPFLLDALTWFGYTGEIPKSAHEQGLALAQLIEQQPNLLVLDGLEPLQHPIGTVGGGLRDNGLRALLKHLAVRNPGLVLISSRQPVVELVKHTGVVHHPLAPLTDTAAVELLQDAGVRGTEAEYQATNQTLQGHALSLSLLAAYLVEYAEGDIRQQDTLAALFAFPEAKPEAQHAFRVIQAHAEQLKGTPELALLNLIGLFDRPVSQAVVDQLRQSNIPILQPLYDLDDRVFQAAVQRLRAQGLYCAAATGQTVGNNQPKGYPLDTHPLIRHYFAYRFRTEHPKDWCKAHTVLYHYYTKVPEQEQPDTLDEMQPLFAAVMHGCAAGLHQQALMEVYYPRIQRDSQTNYLAEKLGAFGTDLAVLAHLFDRTWDQPAAGLTEDDKACVLNWAAFRLRALGRLDEAMQPMQASLDRAVVQQNWKSAAMAASSLSQLHLTRGAVSSAVTVGQQGVKHADRTEDQFWRMSLRTTWADALGQAGDYVAAGKAFVTAEQIQQEVHPEYPQLNSLGGFRYCAWWLAAGEWAQVQQRTTYAIEIAKHNRWLLGIALDQISLGRARLQQVLTGLLPTQPNTNQSTETVPLAPGAQLWTPHQMAQITLNTEQQTQIVEHLDQAQTWLNQAVDGLREAGREDYLPRGLLARAVAARYRAVILPDQTAVQQAQTSAAQDLAEVYASATRSGMLLFLTDWHLEMARWLLTFPDIMHSDPWMRSIGEIGADSEGSADDNCSAFGGLSAAEHIQRACELMDQTGYRWPESAVEHLRTEG